MNSSHIPNNSKRKPKTGPASFEISSTVTISNDLGEQFFYGNAKLICLLRLYKNGDIKELESNYQEVAVAEYDWRSGKRALDIQLEVPSRILLNGSYIALTVSVDPQSEINDEMNMSDITHDELREEWFPEWKKIVGGCVDSVDISSPKLHIFPTTSSPVNITNELPTRSERVAVRKVSDVILYEELSGEIARHLWDAGIITNNLTKDQFVKFLYGQDMLEKKDNIKILELGTGIGLVSIHLSKMFRNAEVLATDLSDAREICDLNIELNDTEDRVKFSELDWEGESTALKDWDLIIITDCTYNPLYYDALLNVLNRESNKDTKIILAHKFREPISESQFFVKIQQYFRLNRQLWYNANGQSLTHIGLYTMI